VQHQTALSLSLARPLKPVERTVQLAATAPLDWVHGPHPRSEGVISYVPHLLADSLSSIIAILSCLLLPPSPRHASKTQTLPAIDTEDPYSSLPASSPLFRNIEGEGGRRRGKERVNTEDMLPFRLRGTSQGQRYRHGQGQKHRERQREGHELGQAGTGDGVRLLKARDKGQDAESDRDRDRERDRERDRDRDRERDSGSPTTATGACLATLVLFTLFCRFLILQSLTIKGLVLVFPPFLSLLIHPNVSTLSMLRSMLCEEEDSSELEQLIIKELRSKKVRSATNHDILLCSAL
jgi:hypothetical protein